MKPSPNPNRRTLSATTLAGTKVVNPTGENLGNVKDLMVNIENGDVTYAVLSFGGFMGLGDKLFAIPWTALRVDTANEQIVLDVPKERLKTAPGFDKDNWPDFADRRWETEIHSYYRQTPYWEI